MSVILASENRDEHGTTLLHALLDARQALCDASERGDLAAVRRAIPQVEQAQAELDAFVASVRQPEPPPAAPAVELENDHHPSFTTRERRWYFGQLANIAKARGWDKGLLHEMSGNVWRRIRGSAMTDAQRRAYVSWLHTEEGERAYLREAHPEVSCFNCGLSYYAHEDRGCPSCGSRVVVEVAAGRAA